MPAPIAATAPVAEDTGPVLYRSDGRRSRDLAHLCAFEERYGLKADGTRADYVRECEHRDYRGARASQDWLDGAVEIANRAGITRDAASITETVDIALTELGEYLATGDQAHARETLARLDECPAWWVANCADGVRERLAKAREVAG